MKIECPSCGHEFDPTITCKNCGHKFIPRKGSKKCPKCNHWLTSGKATRKPPIG